MKNYYRIMLGSGAQFAEQCRAGGYVSIGFFGEYDLTDDLQGPERAFREKYRPIRLAKHPKKGKIGAGLACGVTLAVCKKLETGDVVVCSNGKGEYLVGEITGPYRYHPGTPTPHRRAVHWYDQLLEPNAMSSELRRSVGTSGTGGRLDKYAAELQALIVGNPSPSLIAVDPDVEDPATFAMEKHLEDFLVANWAGTDLGKAFNIYADDEGNTGQQYETDTGRIDILAVSKDQKTILVVELKRAGPATWSWARSSATWASCSTNSPSPTRPFTAPSSPSKTRRASGVPSG